MRMWLIKLRKKYGLSQYELADLLGISRSYYSLIETGSRDPGGKTAKKIADLLDFDMALFYEENGFKSNPNNQHGGMENESPQAG